MNLLNRISLSYIFVSMAVLTIGGIFFFNIFKKEVYEELDEQMRDEKRNIERLLESSDSIPSFNTGINTEFLISPTTVSLHIKPERKDTVIDDPYEGRITFRQWRYTVTNGNDNYLVVIRKSLLDLSDLSAQIFYSLIIGFIILIAGAAMVNYLVLKTTLRPFYHALDQLQKYSLNSTEKLLLSETSTKEFRELNRALESMTSRIEKDFHRTKQFTENASHEIQTPLAIIRNKLELLMQSDNIRNEEANLIQSAYEATERLSRLNKSLILLTKIENQEFQAEKKINIGDLVKRMISDASEKLQLKELNIRFVETAPFKHPINESLAEVLISNLLGNAIRHSEKGSAIYVQINQKGATFSNPGKPFNFHPDHLFHRFFKVSSKSNSLGIGLALAKSIAEANRLRLNYSFQNSTHSFHLES